MYKSGDMLMDVQLPESDCDSHQPGGHPQQLHSEVGCDHGSDAVNQHRRAQVSAQQLHVLQVGAITPCVGGWAWQIQEAHSGLGGSMPPNEGVDGADVFLCDQRHVSHPGIVPPPSVVVVVVIVVVAERLRCLPALPV